jgi:hypothetical protein
MKDELVQKLKEVVSAIIDPDGSLMQEAEKCLSDDNLINFSSSLMSAAQNLNACLEIVKKFGDSINEEDVDELGTLAQALDDTNDPILQKQAALIDELLITVNSDPKAQGAFKKAEDEEVQRLRAKYRETRGDREYKDVKSQHDKENQVNEAIKAVEHKIKAYRPLEAPLSTRYSPDMPGVSLVRIGDSVYQCPVTKKIYDFRAGYTTMKGNKIPGSEVSNQTQHLGQAQEHMNFSTREEALNGS